MPIRIDSTDLVYFPVPKAACTSIKHALLNHNRNGLADRLPLSLPLRGEIRQVHNFYGTHHYHWWYRLQYAGLRWVCVVRDPLERFMSAYANRIVHLGDLGKQECKPKLEAAGLSTAPELDEFVQRFEDYYRLSARVRHHFRPLCDFLGRDPDRFTHVFTLSDLDRFQALCREAGVTLNLPHLQTGGIRRPVSDLQATGRTWLESFYAKDYACWGRYFGG
jgi:hypothetical protein